MKPELTDYDMLDCKIDLNDKEMPLELNFFIQEHKRFYY